MRKSAIVAAAFAAVALALPGAALADTYCVAPATGCSAANTFTDFQAALDQAGSTPAADTVKLGSATYTAPADSEFAYTYPDPVDIVGAGPGATTVTQGGSNGGVQQAALVIIGSDTVSNLTVAVPPWTAGANVGLSLGGSARGHDLTVVPAAGVTLGIGVDLRDTASLDHSTVDLPLSGGSSTFAVQDPDGGDAVTVSDDRLTADWGVNDQGLTQATVHRTAIHADRFGLAAIGGSIPVDDSTIRMDAASTSEGLRAASTSTENASINARHVTIIGADASTTAARVISTGSRAASLTLEESILWGGAGGLYRESGGAPANLTAHYIDLDPVLSYGDTGAGSLMTDHVVNSDPHFVNEAGGDLHLRFDSPLIDAGDPALGFATDESTTDLGGNPRIVGGVRDLGAYEYQRRAPTVTASASSADANPGDTVTFTAAGSDPDPGDTLTYAWSFDDGATATGASAQHAFATPGDHTATVTATDPTGRTGQSPVTVHVAAPAQPAPPSPPAPGGSVLRLLGRSVTVDRTGRGRERARCTGASACQARLVLKVTARRRSVAVGSISGTLQGGGTGVLGVKLTRRGLALLRHSRRGLKASAAGQAVKLKLAKRPSGSR